LFRVVTLSEPPKKELVKFLNGITPPPPRIAKVHVYISKEFHEIFIGIESMAVISNEVFHGRHSHVDTAYMKQVEEACLDDVRVLTEIKALKLPKGATVIVEPWTYATDGMNDMRDRITMCWFYIRLSDHPDANYYAYPIDIVAEVSENLEVTKIYRLPSGPDEAITTEGKDYNHNKVHSSSEYHPELRTEQRTTTKPLHIVQPEGPSFVIEGNHITWEKWTMRVGFNYREGMTLHDVRYDGRSLFYRLSLSEMFVPYGQVNLHVFY
jgi:primary-amine oxidase